MIKTVIVEDKYLTRKGLIRDVDWQSLGFVIVGEAANGAEAIDVIDQQKPDVVITDIMMPVLDGLALIEQIKPQSPDLFILIISGHDEFDFAQRALKAGAYDYVLKPINMPDFIQLLQKLRQSFDHRNEERNRMQNLESQIMATREEQRRKLYQDIVFNQIDPVTAARKAAEINELLDDRYYAVAVARIDNLEVLSFGLDYLQLMELDGQFGQIFQQIAKQLPQILVLETHVGERLVCAMADSETELKAVLNQFGNLFLKHRSEQSILMVSEVHRHANSLKLAYSEALEISKRRFLNAGPSILRYQNFKSQVQIDESHFIKFDDQELIAMIKAGDYGQIERQIERINNLVRREGISSHLQMLMIASSIYFRVINVISETGGSIEEVFINPSASFNKLLYQQTIEGMLGEIREIAFKVSDYISARKTGRFEQVLMRALEYISIHYSDESLGLEDVAQFAMVSSSYLSMIFRQEAKKTFIECLTEVRMNQAQNLILNTDLRTYEIGLKVGYSNPTYFSTIFKKYFGMSPSTYRSQHATAPTGGR